MGCVDARKASSPPVPRWILPAQAVAAVCLVAAVGLRAPHDTWNIPLLLVLGAIAVVSDMVAVESESLLKISGASLALVLAAVLLGGAPAALVGGATILIGWLRWREATHYLRNNLLAFVAFPFIVGTAFHALTAAIGTSPHRTAFYALIVPAYLVAVALNFWLVAGYQCVLDRRSLWVESRRMLQLLITSELVCAVLTVGVAWLAVSVGIAGLILVAIALVGDGAIERAPRRRDEETDRQPVREGDRDEVAALGHDVGHDDRPRAREDESKRTEELDDERAHDTGCL